jgi:[acyl-carrier-protein] S-malonyltransferase
MTGRTALAFSGQGSQRPGMGDPWQHSGSWAVVEQVGRAAGRDVAELLLDADKETLARTDNAQLATFALEMVMLAELGARGLPAVAACAGHSLGEYSALVAAGVVSVDDAAELVAARGTAMLAASEARPGTMGVVVRGGPDEVGELTDRLREQGAEVWVANLNGPGQVVVSGTADGVAAVEREAPTIGGRLIRIPVGGAFHSPLMAPAVEPLSTAFGRVTLRPATVPVVANVDGEPHGADADWAALAARQVVSPVLWERSVRTLTTELGCERIVEIGPGQTLTGLVRRIVPEVEMVPVSTPEALAELLAEWNG